MHHDWYPGSADPYSGFQAGSADPFSGFERQRGTEYTGFQAGTADPYAGFQAGSADPFSDFKAGRGTEYTGFQAGSADPYAGFKAGSADPFSDFREAEFTAQTADQYNFDPARQFSGAEVQQYMDPYMQNVVNVQLLNQLFYLSSHDGMYTQVNAIVNAKIDEITEMLRSSKTKGVQKIYNAEMMKMITSFKKNPTKFKKLNVPKIPDGSPIGMDCE